MNARSESTLRELIEITKGQLVEQERARHRAYKVYEDEDDRVAELEERLGGYEAELDAVRRA